MRDLILSGFLLLFSSYTFADTFAFDPAGGGNASMTASILDQSVGNGLAKDGTTAIGNFIHKSGSTAFTVYYQANLSSLLDDNTMGVFLNGQGGKFFTFTAGVGETVSGWDESSATAHFAFDPNNPVNFFTMYATSAIGNNLTGVGFVKGAPILAAHFTDVISGNFHLDSNKPVPLDGSPNGNQWGQQKTVSGGGAHDFILVVDAVDAKYFPDLKVGMQTYVNGSLVTLFRQVDPSRCFNSGAATCPNGVKSALGGVNGLSGPDLQFQVDANQSVSAP